MAIGVQIALLFLLSCSVASARRAFPHATPPTSSLSPVTLLPSSFITPPPPPFLPLDPSPIKSTTTTPPFLQPRPVKPLFSKVSPRPPSPRRPQFKDDDDDQVQQKPNLNPFSASGKENRKFMSGGWRVSVVLGIPYFPQPALGKKIYNIS